MISALLNTLAARLTAQVPSLRRVARWNSQTTREGAERALLLPAAFLELLPSQAVTQTRDVQHITGTLRVRLACTTRDPDANLALATEVYRALQHYQATPLLVAADRRALYQDTNTDQLEQLIQDFAVKWVDDSRQAPTVPATPTLEVSTQP